MFKGAGFCLVGAIGGGVIPGVGVAPTLLLGAEDPPPLDMPRLEVLPRDIVFVGRLFEVERVLVFLLDLFFVGAVIINAE